MYLLQRITRFRAYQLGSAGSSFSYFDGTTFTLIEARLTNLNRPRIDKEMEICGVSRVGCLHITSWDVDHCQVVELKEILKRYRPLKIEYPGYPPKTDSAKECLALIQGYREIMTTAGATAAIQSIDPTYIGSLQSAESLGYRDVFYHPRYISEKSNDNSTVKLFRTGAFNVASLGDVEDFNIGSYLRGDPLFSTEVDVLILAHHGADNGLTTKKFLKVVDPTIAICSSNYDNQFDHPRDEIRALLREQKINLYTTKMGDVAVQSTGTHTHEYRVINLSDDSRDISSTADFVSKKSNKLRFNMDTIRNVYGPRPAFPR
jgi:competence protein ComEC